MKILLIVALALFAIKDLISFKENINRGLRAKSLIYLILAVVCIIFIALLVAQLIAQL